MCTRIEVTTRLTLQISSMFLGYFFLSWTCFLPTCTNSWALLAPSDPFAVDEDDIEDEEVDETIDADEFVGRAEPVPE